MGVEVGERASLASYAGLAKPTYLGAVVIAQPWPSRNMQFDGQWVWAAPCSVHGSIAHTHARESCLRAPRYAHARELCCPCLSYDHAGTTTLPDSTTTMYILHAHAKARVLHAPSLRPRVCPVLTCSAQRRACCCALQGSIAAAWLQIAVACVSKRPVSPRMRLIYCRLQQSCPPARPLRGGKSGRTAGPPSQISSLFHRFILGDASQRALALARLRQPAGGRLREREQATTSRQGRWLPSAMPQPPPHPSAIVPAVESQQPWPCLATEPSITTSHRRRRRPECPVHARRRSPIGALGNDRYCWTKV